ncbi:MAG: choice-of-anchor D domain-containing protein, partial [Candidatus Thermoplasmatota archaeon]|nr:choice-of-anchor D domain-containing protein [Candidatus Thermoplasmatota archaeon]
NDTVPARLLWVDPLVEGISADTMPSDGYYACLNGQYNSDGDDFWGEPTDGENGDDVDLIADVYVGRAPVGTLSEVNNFVNKTIQYMNYQDNESYLEKMQFVGERLGFGGPSQYGGNHMDELIDGSSNHAYVTMGVPSAYYTIDTLYDRDWMPLPMWPKQELINRINNNTHLLNHLGHADWNKNLKINLTDVMNLTNEHPCFIYSQGCRAGSFDNVFGNDDCIAEYFTVKTPHAAFAGIWNVRYGWGKADSTDGASQRYHREFIDAFFGEGIRSLGLANHDSKHDNLYRINEQCMRYVNYGLNLFGDPAVDLHITALTGENIVIRHDGNIIYNTGSFNIGSLQQNQKSKIITFTIENSGVQPLEFTGVPSIQLQGSCAQDFFVNQFPAVSQLQPGESTVFSVQFAPTKSGRRTADIVIPNNDPYANPYTFSLYGRLWSEAYNQQSGIWYHTIQEAIDDAELNNVILVPEGEYYIESSITLSKAITLRSMNGAGKTILNGVTHHQRCVILDSSGAALKGFTVMNGYAVGNDVGGGIMIASGGSIDSCIVLHNYAEQGGGIYVESNGRITNCDITENVARTNGGGIMLASGGVIERCTIHSNLALNGGGLYSANNGRITHSCLEDNIAYSEGGGLYALSSLAVSNSLLAANTAYWSGGIYLGGSQQGTTQSFDLCTIATNFAENGINDPMFPVCGGIYAVDSASYIRISNSIVADNKRNDIGGTDDVVISNYIGSLHFEYTCTTPLPSSGFGNINDDPLFVFLGSLHPYSLQAGSPCINAGNPNDIPLPLRDLAGKPRLVNGRVDMGCYEFQLSTPPGGSSVEVDPEIN